MYLHRLFIPAIIPLLFCGCIHFQQEISIKADGGMEIEYLYSIPEEYISAFATGKEIIEKEQGKTPAADYLAWPLNEELVRKTFDSDNLSLQNYREWQENGRLYVQIQAEVSDIASVTGDSPLPRFTLKRQDKGGEKDNFYEFSMQQPFSESTDKEEQIPDAGREELEMLLEDLRMVLLVTVPGTITNTTGTVEKDSTASWQFSINDRRKADWLTKEPDLTIIFNSDIADLPETAD